MRDRAMLMRHSAIYVAAKLAPGALGMATTALLTRMLDPGQYGLYGLSLVVMTFGASMGFDWLGVAFMRFTQGSDGNRIVASTVLRLFAGLVLLTAVLAAAAWGSGLLHGQDGPVIAAGLLMMWSFSWFELMAKIEIAGFRPGRYFAMNMGRAVCSLLGACSAAWLTRDPVWTAIGTAAGTAAGAAFGGFRFLKAGPGLFDTSLARSVLLFGLPLAASNALGGMVGSGTRALVGMLGSAASLGLYTAAYLLVQNTLAVVAAGIAAASYSLAVRAVESGDAAAARRQLLANSRLLLAVMAPATIGMMLTGQDLASVLVGHQYVATVARLTPWMAAGTFFGVIRAHYLDHAFQLGRKPHLQIWVAGFAACWALGLGAWLIPRHGPTGAAIAMTVAMAISCLHAWFAGKRAYPLPFPGDALARVGFACAAMALVVLLVPGSGAIAFAARVGLGGCAYACMGFATDVLGLRHRKIDRQRAWPSLA